MVSNQLEEIGRRLRTARETRGLSLTMAEEETKIRKKYLEALETGDRTDLPDEVYVKGFIRTYGNYLGVDGESLVEEYKRAQRTEDTAAGGRPQSRPPATVAAARSGGRPAGGNRRPVRAARATKPGPAMAWGVGLAVAAAGMALLFVLWWPGGAPAPDPGKQAPPVTAPPVATPPVTPVPVTPTSPGTPPPEELTRVEVGAAVNTGPSGPYMPVTVSPGPISLTLTFRDRAWVGVEADGKQVVQGIFQPGQAEKFSGTEKLVVTVGWVEVVDFTVNGKALGAVAREPQRRVEIAAKKP